MSASDPALIVYPEVVAFGGEERVLLALAGHLHDRGIPYRVACYRDRVDLARHADFPIEIEEIALDASGFAGKARALRRRLDAHRSSRRPLLFGWQTASHVGALGRSDYFIRIADTPSLMSPPVGLPARAKSAILDRIAARGLRHAIRCIANADYIGAELKQAFGAPATTVYVPGKAPPVGVVRMPDLADLRILSVSRLEANKRVDWLIDAVAALAQARAGRGQPPVRLDIVGQGPQAQALRDQAARQGITDLVTFHGFVDDPVLEQLYAEATVFAMPAWQGFGLPALEALYRRLPVVQHRESGVSELLQGTPWVELFDGGRDALRDALDRMLARLETGAIAEPVPWLPTADSFGAGIIDICGW